MVANLPLRGALALCLPLALAYNVLPVARQSPVRTARSAVVRLQEAAPQQIVSEETYGMMLSTLLKTNKSIAGEISSNYAMVDYAFMQRLCAPARKPRSEERPLRTERRAARACAPQGGGHR